MDEKKLKGFTYEVSKAHIDNYRSWPIERRLQWLLAGNKLRKSLPERVVAIQDEFRNGKR